MKLGQLAGQLADQLAASGVPVVTDIRNARVPGAVLQLDTIDSDRLIRDTRDINWRLVILGSPAGTTEALDTLGDQLERINAVVPLADIEATAFTVPNLSPDPLPALTATIATEITED